MNEKSIPKNDLIRLFEKALIDSGYIIQLFEKCENGFVKFVILKEKIAYSLHVNIRNISSAYLPKKPDIFRRQVSKLDLDEIPMNTKYNASMLIGVYSCDNEYLVTCWNPFHFSCHETNRSCYVLKNSFDNAKMDGFYYGNDCSTPVWICSITHFSQLLEDYITRNSIE